MIRDVIKKGNPILEKECKPIEDIEIVKKIIRDLTDTIDFLKTTHEFKRGIGLAAPQIGESVQLSVVESNKGERYVLINPKIIETSKLKKPIREGCISFLEYRAYVNRYIFVKVEAINENGQKYYLEGKNDFAMLLQHEIDHLHGILYFKHLPNGERDLQKC